MSNERLGSTDTATESDRSGVTSPVETVYWTFRRHAMAMRVLVVEFVLLALAWTAVTVSSTDLANVVFGLLVVMAGALGLVSLLAGLSIQVQKWRR